MITLALPVLAPAANDTGSDAIPDIARKLRRLRQRRERFLPLASFDILVEGIDSAEDRMIRDLGRVPAGSLRDTLVKAAELVRAFDDGWDEGAEELGRSLARDLRRLARE